MIKYTSEDLRKNYDEYESVFHEMMQYIDTPKHKEYLKRLEAIEAYGDLMRASLGIIKSSPCPIRTVSDCSECTGRYVEDGRRNTKKMEKLYKMVTVGGYKCAIKEVFRKKVDLNVVGDGKHVKIRLGKRH